MMASTYGFDVVCDDRQRTISLVGLAQRIGEVKNAKYLNWGWSPLFKIVHFYAVASFLSLQV